MVIAVYAEPLHSQNAGERSVPAYLYEVGDAVVRRAHVVLRSAGVFRGNVLVERAAKSGVHKLNAPAYAEDGTIQPDGFL